MPDEATAIAPDASAAEGKGAPPPPAPPTLPPFDVTRPRLFNRVTIQLDRERPLHLNFKALRLFEQQTGVGAWDDVVWDRPYKLKLLSTLLWAALLEDDPTLTLDALYELPGMEFGNIHYIWKTLQDCWGSNHPQPEAKGTNGTAGPKPTRPPG